MKRALAIRDAEALIDALKLRYHLSEAAAARQVTEWLGLARAGLDRKAHAPASGKEGHADGQ